MSMDNGVDVDRGKAGRRHRQVQSEEFATHRDGCRGSGEPVGGGANPGLLAVAES